MKRTITTNIVVVLFLVRYDTIKTGVLVMKLLFKQRIFSWLDSYDVYDENGETVYTVKGQLSFGHKLLIYNKYNEHVGTIKEQALTFL